MVFVKVLLASVAILIAGASVAAESRLDVDIVYLSRQEEPLRPLSLLDLVIEDNGIPGSTLGLKDTQTTGSFLNQFYNLEHIIIEEDADLPAAFRELTANGKQLFILDLDATDLQVIANIDPTALLFSIRAMDDELRNDACAPTVFHFPPSRSMLADALAQYLAWKRWTRVVLATGRHETDSLYADALRRAADRYGLKIVQEKNWTAVPGARRTDSGHYSLQQEVPVFSQFKDHDVLLVADEMDEFGEYLSYRTTRARPVAGTHGLIPTAWHRTQEQWGATQIQRRFQKLAGRTMTGRDYAAWAAMRTFGEAVTNSNSVDPTVLRDYILSDKFKLAGFKGVPLTFRRWNGQLRQPILVVGPRMLVTVSPQKGFLHERSELDTLGYDEPESACQAFGADIAK